MSDYDESEMSNQSDYEQEHEEIIDTVPACEAGPNQRFMDTPKHGYYKSKKGDADKRKVTSKLNAEKARLTKLAKMEQEKKLQQTAQQYEYEDSTDDSSSEEEFHITRKRPTKAKSTKQLPTKHKKDPMDDRLGKLEEMILKLAANKSKKRVAKKTVIHTHVSVPPVDKPKSAHKPFLIDLMD